MKCRHFFSFALVAFLSFFFGSFITTHNTFALDDIVYNLERPTSSFTNYDFCGLNTGITCSDYSYVIFHPTRITYSYYEIGTGRATLRFPTFSDIILFTNSSYSRLSFSFNSGAPISALTVTLTNTLPSDSPTPSGNLDITENGTYDVSSYAQATVNVPAEVIQGDYHDDLVNIQKSIIICGAILLVLYFFYCIYRLIIKNSGVH